MVKQIVTAKDVMTALEVSESKAYGIIKQLNQELAAKGFITIPGKVPIAYFEEKLYGGTYQCRVKKDSSRASSRI